MADLDRLQAVLEVELERGCDNTAVEGGLDELIRTQARGEQPGSPLLRMVANLPAAGYRSLIVEERRVWARRAIATIVHHRAEAKAETMAPGTPRPPRPRAMKATKPATARTPRAPKASTPLVPPGPEALQVPLRQAGFRLGPTTFDRLERLGIKTIGDALRTYPYRHLDFSQSVPVSQVRVGVQQTVRGTIDRVAETRMGRGGRMRSSEAWLTDEFGSRIQLVWFNQPFIARTLHAGTEIAVSGTPSVFRGRPTFHNPEFERLGEGGGMHTGRMIPMYHLTEGLPQRRLRDTIATLVERYADRMPDPLPPDVRHRNGMVGIVEAIRQIHYPDSQESLNAARRRLAFEELLAIQIGVVGRKRIWQEQGDAPRIDARATAEAFLATLPYRLTGAQRRALDDVLTDIARPVPMARLVEGDVGSGKTVVALAALLGAVAAGMQGVMMAPTEVLADQHFRTICTLLAGEPEPPLNGLVYLPFLPEPLKIVLLTGSTRAKERREALDAIASGGAQIVVGTHALIQETVAFQRLGLAVVDEQHRFGVMQRSALRDKGGTPHLMVMTATPIPRSLALTVYGDLDLSVIDEMPPGRTPIDTQWLPPERRHEAFTHLRHEIEAGRQGFVICPLVEGSDSVASRAATEEIERLRTQEFPDLADRIALLHGRMSARDKDGVMQAFAKNESVILVSTAVVEVGIDVPNATVMVIEGADRFGLAQLHQFRGRVGRGKHPSTCYLLADDPTPEAEERLSLVARTRDGFALAQADLELRGPGDTFGTRQSGLPSLHVASLLDAQLIARAREEAETLLDRDPRLTQPEHAPLRALVARIAEDVVAEIH
ncbi:MAG: ATP-dependent DNA helicase RecG [Dehalococcoidia bacterium]